MPNLGGSSGGRVPKRPKSVESCNEKNVENFTPDGKSKSRTPSDRGGSSRAKEQFESRPNNLDSYDWQPGSSLTDNSCQLKKRNEDREWGKWSYQPWNYGSSEEGAELGSRKVVNRQLCPGQRASVATLSTSRPLSSYQQHQQLTLSDMDESLGHSRENLEKERQSESEGDLPDADQLFGHLLRLQNSIKQASVMLDKIMLLPEPQRSEQKAHLLSILRQLKEEEYGYKVLLRGIQTSKEVEENMRSDASGISCSSGPDIGQVLPKEDEENQDRHVNVSKPNNRKKFRPHFPVVTSDRQTEMMPQPEAADDQGSTVAGSEVSVVSLQRRHLQEKIENLQEKKEQMDNLLGKLQLLKSDHLHLDSDDAAVWSIMNSVRASSSADRTASDAEQMLTKMETRHKLKKLKEMRERLDQLRTLMQFYQNGDVDSVPADGATGENSSHEDSAVDDEDEGDEESKFSRASVLPNRGQPNRRLHMVSHFRGQPSRRLSGDNCDELVPLNSSTYSREHEGQKRNVSLACEGLLQRIDGAGVVAEKIRELEAASDKLRRLQLLVAMVQQSGGGSEDVAMAVSELEDGVEDRKAGQRLSGDVEDESQREDEEFYAQKMREQQKELRALKAERQRLLKLHTDHDKVQENIPDDLVADEDRRTAEPSARVRHPLDGKWVTRDERTTPRASAAVAATKRTIAPSASQEMAQVTFQEPLESVVSNEEVYDQMRWQRMLREEQREKKRGRVNGEVAPKRSSANQDGRSEGASTYRSDQYRISPSEDVTMATWGGSTAGNLESIEENENRSNRETGDDEDGDDGDNEKDDDDDDEDESDNMLHVEEEEEEEDALNNEDDDDDDVEDFDEETPDVAPTRKWRQKPANEDNVRVDIRHNDRSSVIKQRLKDKNQGLSVVQESILSLKKQVAQLANAVKKVVKCKRRENRASSTEQATQLQQNQLFLGLNQSYFQLIATQSNLMERFNRLEQLVLNSQNEIGVSDGFYPAGQDPEKPAVSPFPIVVEPWHQDADFSRSASLILEPGRTKQQQDLDVEVNFMDDRSSSVKRISPVVSTCPATRDYYSGAYSPQEACELACPIGRPIAKRTNGRYLGMSDLEEPEMSRDPRMLDTSRSPRFENAEEVVIRQQNSGSARASAMAHLASQKVVDAKDDQRFLRAIADDVSVSSVPGSCSEPPSKPDERTIAGNDGRSFERLSDEIYSEVASLISQNEHCPDFLIQLFRKLQCLSTDFLRQRALYALRDLVCHVPPEAEMQYFACESSHLNGVARQPGMIPLPKPPCVEDGAGMSGGQSTPSPCNTSQWENPFESDPLGDTVIHFGKMLQSVRESEQKMADAQNSSAGRRSSNARDAAAAADAASASAVAGRWSNSSVDRQPKTDSSRAPPPPNEKGSEGSVSDDTCPRIDAHELDQQIKRIMMDVIPVVKEHINGVCSQPLLKFVEDLVMSLVHHTDYTQPEFERFFHRQLATILRDSLAKFEGRKMVECGEDLLVELSEILFNELAFFCLMQNLDRSKAQVKAKLLTWQKNSPASTSSGYVQKRQKTTNDSSSSVYDSGELTESDLESVDAEKEMNSAGELVNTVGVDGAKERTRQKENEKYFGIGDKERKKDASNCELAVMDEFMEEDEYYTENMKFLNDNESIDDSFSMDGSFCNSNVKIELAPSETKPFTRIGSDEDDEAADEAASAGDPYETAVSRDAEKERCSKTSSSSAAGSVASMERGESSCKGSVEKEEEEEKEKDTQETDPPTIDADAGSAGESVEDESGTVQVVEAVDGEQVVKNKSSDASANQNVTGPSTVESGSVQMA